MTLDEFINYRSVIIKNESHRKIVSCFYSYLSSVFHNKTLMPEILGKILNRNYNDVLCVTGCFNGINDGTISSFNDVDFFVKMSNGDIIYIFESMQHQNRKLKENEAALFFLDDSLEEYNIVEGE